MQLFEIEAQLKKLQEEYYNTARRDIKEKLKAINELDESAEDISVRQRQYLIDLITSNSATWSGGPASINNLMEATTRDIAITLMQDLNRGFLEL